jgi:hypothetical protein
MRYGRAGSRRPRHASTHLLPVAVVMATVVAVGPTIAQTPGDGPVDSPPVLTLDRAIELALEHAPAAVAAEAALRGPGRPPADPGRASPVVGLTSIYNNSSNQRFDQATGQLVSESYTAQVTGSYEIFSGGRRWPSCGRRARRGRGGGPPPGAVVRRGAAGDRDLLRGGGGVRPGGGGGPASGAGPPAGGVRGEPLRSGHGHHVGSAAGADRGGERGARGVGGPSRPCGRRRWSWAAWWASPARSDRPRPRCRNGRHRWRPWRSWWSGHCARHRPSGRPRRRARAAGPSAWPRTRPISPLSG